MKEFSIFIISVLASITLSGQEFDSITDARDGQLYRTVKIGDQWWMAENLKATKYSDDLEIPLVTKDSVWSTLESNDKAYCFYNNSDSLWEIYGTLYTWPAAMNGETSSEANPSDVQGVCPTGWHLPSDEEWKLMESFLGMSQSEINDIGWRGTNEGGMLKETDTLHWISPNQGATNESGFTALGGGGRDNSGGFDPMNHIAMWSTTEYDSTFSLLRSLGHDRSKIYRHYREKTMGLNVRCIKNNPVGADDKIISLDDLVRVYPNPCVNFVKIESHVAGKLSIRLTSMNGQLHINQVNSDPIITLDLSSLKNGIYFITIISDDFITTKKIFRI